MTLSNSEFESRFPLLSLLVEEYVKNDCGTKERFVKYGWEFNRPHITDRGRINLLDEWCDFIVATGISMHSPELWDCDVTLLPQEVVDKFNGGIIQ